MNKNNNLNLSVKHSSNFTDNRWLYKRHNALLYELGLPVRSWCPPHVWCTRRIYRQTSHNHSRSSAGVCPETDSALKINSDLISGENKNLDIWKSHLPKERVSTLLLSFNNTNPYQTLLDTLKLKVINFD